MTQTCEECRQRNASCPWWCPVDQRHHPVRDMVTYCLERATG